jgi:hypothetical protein
MPQAQTQAQAQTKADQAGAQEQQGEHPADQVEGGLGIQDRQHSDAKAISEDPISEDAISDCAHDEHHGRRGICGTPRRLFVWRGDAT